MAEFSNKVWKKSLAVLMASITVLLFTSGCSLTAKPAATATEPVTLNMAAASDLQGALTEIAENYEKETAVKVNLNFGSSGLLARQIEQGAPVDLFASAGAKYTDELAEQGLVYGDKRLLLAYGRLALVFGEGAGAQSLDTLAGKDIERVAIANPDHAPYGQAAKEVLVNTGLWTKIKSKLVYGDNVAQALQFVTSGNADVALVALSQVKLNHYRYELIDESLHQPIKQQIIVLKDSDRRPDAVRLAKFIIDTQSREILGRYGFRIANE